MPTCPYCNAEVRKTQRTCYSCGQSLTPGMGGSIKRLLKTLGRLLIRPRTESGGSRIVRTNVSPIASGNAVHRPTVQGLDDLPPEMRAAVEKLAQRNPDGDLSISSTKMMTTGPITVKRNGVTHTYDSPDDLPPEMRAALQTAMRESGPTSRFQVNIDGVERTYDSLEDMPPDIREMVERMQNGN